MTLFIKNAQIIDGTGSPSYLGAVFVEENKIEKIIMQDKIMTEKKEDTLLQYESNADTIIDAKGLVLAPGFIDTHSHSDLKVLEAPELLPKIMQGITTEVLGQDGISMAPLPTKHIESWRRNLAGLDGESDSIDWSYENTEGYLKLIEKAQPAINEAYLLPHGNIRMEAMGLSSGTPTKKDIERMKEVTRREMEAGCYGVSSGLIYMPCAYSETLELIEICRAVKEYEGVFVVHQRSEADDILESMEEILRIGRESGVPIHFSHFKICGKKNWAKLSKVFDLLEKGKEEGLMISFDQYPYVAGSTMLSVILPPWVHNGGAEILVERLGDSSLRKKIIEDIHKGIPGWDNFVDIVGTENIYITSVSSKKNAELIGLNLVELGQKRQKSPLESAMDLLAEEKNAVGMVDYYGTEEHVLRIMNRPEMNACTDGLLSGKPHPRAYGAFPRILGKYVREENGLTIEEAIYKMTNKAALAMGIKKRGRIQESYFADITLFNPATIIDKGDYVNPDRYPEGINYVIVNGSITVKEGKYIGNRSGYVLRKNKNNLTI